MKCAGRDARVSDSGNSNRGGTHGKVGARHRDWTRMSRYELEKESEYISSCTRYERNLFYAKKAGSDTPCILLPFRTNIEERFKLRALNHPSRFPAVLHIALRTLHRDQTHPLLPQHLRTQMANLLPILHRQIVRRVIFLPVATSRDQWPATPTAKLSLRLIYDDLRQPNNERIENMEKNKRTESYEEKLHV